MMRAVDVRSTLILGEVISNSIAILLGDSSRRPLPHNSAKHCTIYCYEATVSCEWSRTLTISVVGTLPPLVLY